MDNQGDFDKIEGAAADRRRQQSLDDLNNEMSGNEVGRLPRFLSSQARQILLDKKNGKQSAAMSALDLALMSNPAFAAAYEQAMHTLSKAENVAERVLGRLETQLADFEAQLKGAQAEHQSTLDNAATLADGTKVFRDAKGAVWDDRGKRVDNDIAATIEWSGLEPSYETHQMQLQSIDDLKISTQATKDSIHEVRVYQTDVLGDVRADLSNPDHSGSVEDVEAAKDRVIDQMPDIMREEFRLQMVEPEKTASTTFAIPERVL